jgi:hypothetical protein
MSTEGAAHLSEARKGWDSAAPPSRRAVGPAQYADGWRPNAGFAKGAGLIVLNTFLASVAVHPRDKLAGFQAHAHDNFTVTEY